MRTDLVYFAPIPLVTSATTRAPLSESFVYVPAGGMTWVASFRCMNDQAFLCPRHLCRPYFRLLELWTSPLCNATVPTSTATMGATAEGQATGGTAEAGALAAPRSIFAGDFRANGIRANGFRANANANGLRANGVHAPPSAAYVLPRPPPEPLGGGKPMSAQCAHQPAGPQSSASLVARRSSLLLPAAPVTLWLLDTLSSAYQLLPTSYCLPAHATRRFVTSNVISM